jgi:anti-sigma regulatory factor (Ser/Thr protein kinase)
MHFAISEFSSLSGVFSSSIDPAITELQLDLTNCHFIDAKTVTCLAQLIIKCIRDAKVVKILPPGNVSVRSYITTSGLYNFVESNWKQPSQFKPSERDTTLGLWSVSTEHKEYFTRAFKNYFESLKNNKDFSAIQTYFHELISNVYDHAESPTGAITFGQYYPKTGEITLIVVDLGVGIPSKVNNYLASIGKETLTAYDALLTAFKPKFTTESQPNNRGAGLDTIRTLVGSLGGNLSVYTNGTFVEFKPSTPNGETDRSRVIEHLYGTTIVITINVANFSKRESLSDPFSFT